MPTIKAGAIFLKSGDFPGRVSITSPREVKAPRGIEKSVLNGGASLLSTAADYAKFISGLSAEFRDKVFKIIIRCPQP